MLLRELGCPFTLKLVDRSRNAQNSAAYLKLNPNGKIPVLVDGREAIFETAAIGLYLADRFPESGLAPRPDEPRRAAYLRWMVYLSSTPQAEFRAWFYPHEFVDDPSLAGHAKAAAGARLVAIFERSRRPVGRWALAVGRALLGRRPLSADAGPMGQPPAAAGARLSSPGRARRPGAGAAGGPGHIRGRSDRRALRLTAVGRGRRTAFPCPWLAGLARV